MPRGVDRRGDPRNDLTREGIEKRVAALSDEDFITQFGMIGPGGKIRVPPGSMHRETGVEYDARIGKSIPEGFRVSDDGSHYTDDKGMTIHPESPEEMAYRRRKAEGYY